MFCFHLRAVKRTALIGGGAICSETMWFCPSADVFCSNILLITGPGEGGQDHQDSARFGRDDRSAGETTSLLSWPLRTELVSVAYPHDIVRRV